MQPRFSMAFSVCRRLSGSNQSESFQSLPSCFNKAPGVLMRHLLVSVTAVLVGCAQTSAIHLASSRQSPFVGAVYAGEEATIAKTPPGSDEYRVFHQGASSFVPLQALRDEAESRAARFCERSGKGLMPLREVASRPPHVLGNFPRIELIFACVTKGAISQGTPANLTRPPNAPPTVSTGTGFAVINSITVATAYHVIDGADSITLECGSGAETSAAVVRVDPANDLAFLRASAPAPVYLELASDNSLVLGQRVFTVGFPVPGLLGTDAKYTDGAVSALSGLQGAASLLQITVPIQPGNSGGPLLNEAGQVVGVITSTAAIRSFLNRTGTLPQNVNWAVRSEYLKPLLAGQTGQLIALNVSAVERAQRSVCLVRARVTALK